MKRKLLKQQDGVSIFLELLKNVNHVNQATYMTARILSM